MSPYFASYLPALHPLIRSKHPPPILPALQGPDKDALARAKSPSRRGRPGHHAAPLPQPPPCAGAALQGHSAQARHARSPARGGWGQRCAAWRHSLFVWPRYAARGGGRPGYRRAHVAPMALRTRSADAPLAPPPPLAG